MQVCTGLCLSNNYTTILCYAVFIVRRFNNFAVFSFQIAVYEPVGDKPAEN